MAARLPSAPRLITVLPLVLCAALACAAVVTFAALALRRSVYPYDLEWMEGSMLCHALRLRAGLGIYVPPSVDFIPHLYTPLYPALLAALDVVGVPIGYLPARVVSLLGLGLALVAGAALVLPPKTDAEDPRTRRLAALAALSALALPCATFAAVGGFYDLVRSDALQLGLTTLGAALAWRGRRDHRLAALAALVLVAAFLTKQTAAPLLVAIGLALLGTRRAPALTFGLCGVASGALALWLIDRAAHGWFWTYIFRLHQGHAFFARRAFVDTPLQLAAILGPALLLVPLALWRRRDPDLLFLTWLALAGALASALGFGTQWAHVNAYIPGVFFPALAIAAAAQRLVQDAILRGAILPPLLCAALVSLSLALPLRALRPAAHLPTAADRTTGDALIARLRRAPGEVLIPFHPFYAHLAGKRTFLHRMGVWDVRGTPADPVRGLREAFAARRFSLIVFDQKVEGTWHDWPGVLDSYRISERFSGPRTVEGADTRPGLILVPTPAPGTAAGLDLELQ